MKNNKNLRCSSLMLPSTALPGDPSLFSIVSFNVFLCTQRLFISYMLSVCDVCIIQNKQRNAGFIFRLLADGRTDGRSSGWRQKLEDESRVVFHQVMVMHICSAERGRDKD